MKEKRKLPVILMLCIIFFGVFSVTFISYKCKSGYDETVSSLYSLEDSLRHDLEYFERHDQKHSSNDTKYILMWNKAYGNKNLGIGFGSTSLFEYFGCEETRCLTTDNRSMMDIRNFDAILFHELDLWHKDLPQDRSENQRYVFWLQEAPQGNYASSLMKQTGLKHFFNWTMTYRLDSDFPTVAGHFIQISTHPTGEKLKQHIRQFGLKNARRAGASRNLPKAAWFVSNCNGRNRRNQVAKAIGKHYPVDIYGKCGTFHCDRKFQDQCYQNISRSYRFYLSFENANCKDYVTEKFFNILHYDLVPVVYGGADYARFAPPHSYIDVRDFETVEQLSQFLHELTQDDAKYASYFWWKEHFILRNDHTNRMHRPVCDLCRRLHNLEEPKSSYPNMKEWWMAGSKCSANPPFIV